MPKFIDLTGRQFGYLTVIKRIESKSGKTRWLCRCKCGNFATPTTHRILHHKSVPSCGCYALEPGNRTIKHGMKHTSIYSIWCSMKKRCNNPNNKSYSRYGAKGITVCKEWNDSFENFMQWSFANGYKEGLSIDRINNALGYMPSNCRWVTMQEQALNRTTNLYLTQGGETHCLAEWSRILGFDYAYAKQRYEILSRKGVKGITLDMLIKDSQQ